MSRYSLSPAAQADLEKIWDYTYDRWGGDQAEEHLRAHQHTIERAATNPRIGRACDEIRPGYRKLAAGSHVLFYRVMPDDLIDVVRVCTNLWMSTAICDVARGGYERWATTNRFPGIWSSTSRGAWRP